jgi:hypothetical protein
MAHLCGQSRRQRLCLTIHQQCRWHLQQHLPSHPHRTAGQTHKHTRVLHHAYQW